MKCYFPRTCIYLKDKSWRKNKYGEIKKRREREKKIEANKAMQSVSCIKCVKNTMQVSTAC